MTSLLPSILREFGAPHRAGLLLVLSGTLGCDRGNVGSAAADTADLPVFSAPETTLSLGTLEGDPNYEFGAIESVLRLSDGRIAVSDAGAGAVSVFSPDGEFEDRIGSSGDGPGEFGRPSRLFAGEGDSLGVWDARRRHVAWFDLDGEWGRDMDPEVWTAESVYALDAFPASRYLVDGPRTAASRAAVGSVVASLPHPGGSSLVRRLRVADTGELWIEEDPVSRTGSRWMVLDAAGTARRWVELPAGFEPHRIGASEVLGVRSDDLGVEYVESRPLVATDESAPVPGWFASPASLPSEPAVTSAEMRDAALLAIKEVASLQEIHYAEHFSYTTDLSALPLDQISMDIPDGVRFEIPRANDRGWILIVAHPELPTVCTMALGAEVPAGWRAASIDCGTRTGVGGEPPPWATAKDASSKTKGGGKR